MKISFFGTSFDIRGGRGISRYLLSDQLFFSLAGSPRWTRLFLCMVGFPLQGDAGSPSPPWGPFGPRELLLPW